MATEIAKIVQWLSETVATAKKRGRGSIAVPTAHLDALLAEHARLKAQIEARTPSPKKGRCTFRKE